MADYTRTTLSLRYSESSDYSDPLVSRAIVKESTSNTVFVERQFSAATTGTSISLSTFSTLDAVSVLNKDSTNFLSFTYKTGAGAATAQIMKLLAGQQCLLRDVTPGTALVFTADTAAVEVDLIAFGT